MKVSVLICTRNRAQSIVHCLDSIDAAARAASLTDAEIIVIDNASEDNTSSIVQKWAARSSIPVRLDYEPRMGISIAKNRGLRSARGEILVLTDDDCRLQSDYFVELLRLHASDTIPALRGGRVELGNKADLELTIKTDTDPSAGILSAALRNMRIWKLFSRLQSFYETAGLRATRTVRREFWRRWNSRGRRYRIHLPGICSRACN